MRLFTTSALLGMFALAPPLAASLHAQAPAAGVPDLSGAWRGQPLMSVSTVDAGAKLRGKEPDIPYQDWAREKMLAEIPPIVVRRPGI